MKNILLRKLYLLLPALLLAWLPAAAQQPVQTLGGTVVDQQSKTGIANASVSIAGTSFGATTDSLGSFSLHRIPLGRVTLIVTHIGYEPRQLFNIVVEAGKQTVLDIELLEKMSHMENEVVVLGRRKPATARMATVSAVAFNAEDTRRFAGSRNDIARMASNFAGVNSVNDGSNDIIIRGNSPLGLLWRLEGVDIPNPNHFGSLGATGGPVGMLNNNVIGQSAFYTGAFPAQFGNATSGVFDLNLRRGNPNRQEFTAQVGFNGLEAGAEGPLSKKGQGSYLVYYRYSIPGLLQSLGLDVGTGGAVPSYQDISLKVDLPMRKAGRLTLFGMGGASDISFKGQLKDTANFYNDPYHDLYNRTKMGVAGIKHTYFFNERTSSVLTVAATGTNVVTRQDSLDASQMPHKNYREDGSEWRYMASLVLNKKISASDRVEAGITADQLHYRYQDSILDANHGFIPFLQESSQTWLLRGYLQWQHRFSPRLTLNTGVYSQYLALNANAAVDARVGLRYAAGSSNLFTIAYGGHSQMQPLMMYFHETKVAGAYVQTNLDLGFTRSHHLVAGWEHSFQQAWKMKWEAYGQWLNKVPVEGHLSDWSALNIGAGYGAGLEDSLVNKGTGYNYGLELTAEKPFSNGWYFLGTLSLFDSKYKGSNGVQHNTVFNGNYVANVLGGKEWRLGDVHTIAVDLKGTLAGGKRYTPILEEESRLSGTAVYDDAHAFELQAKPYFRIDVKLTYRMNSKGFMQEFFVDFQNLTDHKNVFSQWYDSRSEKVRTQNQLGFWPNFNYRIQF